MISLQNLPSTTSTYVVGFCIAPNLHVVSTSCQLCPQSFLINETFLDASTATISLPNYQLISRRDRGSLRGGIALFAHTSIHHQLAYIHSSTTCERTWHILHTTSGPLLLCTWYRPPASNDIHSINNFINELSTYSTHASHTIIIGDLNLHHAYWLQSPRTTPEASRMFNFCRDNGFTQYVNTPTHAAGNRLDLVISDLASGIRAHVEPIFHAGDHHPILCNVSISTPTTTTHQTRVLWDSWNANWAGINRFFISHDWSWILSSDTDAAVTRFTRILHAAIHRYIPKLPPTQRNPTHPWMNNNCIRAVQHKLTEHRMHMHPPSSAVRYCIQNI